MTRTEPKNSSPHTVQLNVSNKKANNSQTSAVIEGRSESDVPINQHVDTASPHDADSSLVKATAFDLLISETNASEKDVFDDCDHGGGSPVETLDVNTKSVYSSQGGLSETGHKLERYCGKTPDVNAESVNTKSLQSSRGRLSETGHKLERCDEKTPAVNTEFVNTKSLQSSQGGLSETDHKLGRCCEETRAVNTEFVNTKSAHSSQGGLLETGHKLESCDVATKPDEVFCLPTSEETDANGTCATAVNCMHTNRHTCEEPCRDLGSRLSPKDLPAVVDLHSSQSLRSLGSSDLPNTEAKYDVAKNCSAETSENDNHSVLVVGGSGEMAKLPSHTSVTSESPVGQDSATETGSCIAPSMEKATVEISIVKTQCCQTEECPLEASVVMVNAQNSPIQCPTTRSVGCTSVQLLTTVVEVSHSDIRLADTVECSVQTSPCVVDASCSPLHSIMTCSIGCSPVEIKTRSARSSPILFPPAVGRSMQTEPWMIDAQCSPVVLPRCEDSHMANAMTSPQQCSTKRSTAYFSTERPKSQKGADGTPTTLRQNNPLPACAEAFCPKLPSTASAVGSESSYATPPVVASSGTDPLQIAVIDAKESREDSTQPHSCEELFDDVSPLSYKSPSSTAHHPCSAYPSALFQHQASPSETKNIISDTLPANSEDHAAQYLDSSYSLESSQVLPKCSDKELNENIKSSRATTDDETVIQQQFE